MLEALKQYVADTLAPPLPPGARARLREDARVNSAGYDPWGLHVETAERTIQMGRWIYERYFRVRAQGIERVPAGRVMLVANHGGQLPFDGLLVAMAMALEADPPRIVRGMVERWFPSLPFVSTLFTRCGQTVGDPRNCEALLEREQAILVFPEGVRGSGKTYWRRYQLQGFGTGFLRLALAAKAPIVPVALVGTEETYPSVYDAAWLAKLLGVPYVPVTPFFPLLGPLGAVPLPVRIDLHFGEPLHFEGHPDAPDEEVNVMVRQVTGALQGMIDRGLARRPGLSALQWLPGGRRPDRLALPSGAAGPDALDPGDGDPVEDLCPPDHLVTPGPAPAAASDGASGEGDAGAPRHGGEAAGGEVAGGEAADGEAAEGEAADGESAGGEAAAGRAAGGGAPGGGAPGGEAGGVAGTRPAGRERR